MHQQAKVVSHTDPVSVWSGGARWGAGVGSLILLVGVGALDVVTGQQTSLTLLYLLPIALATYFLGRRAGMILSALAAATALVIALRYPTSIIAEFWNAGTRLGVFLVFSALLHHVHEHHLGAARRQIYRLLGISIGAACLLAGMGWALEK